MYPFSHLRRSWEGFSVLNLRWIWEVEMDLRRKCTLPKCSTDQRFIRKRNTTYKIGTLIVNQFLVWNTTFWPAKKVFFWAVEWQGIRHNLKTDFTWIKNVFNTNCSGYPADALFITLTNKDLYYNNSFTPNLIKFFIPLFIRTFAKFKP